MHRKKYLKMLHYTVGYLLLWEMLIPRADYYLLLAALGEKTCKLCLGSIRTVIGVFCSECFCHYDSRSKRSVSLFFIGWKIHEKLSPSLFISWLYDALRWFSREDWATSFNCICSTRWFCWISMGWPWFPQMHLYILPLDWTIVGLLQKVEEET